MTLINITLDDNEQELLLSCARVNELVGSNPYSVAWNSIGEKITRARDSSAFEIYPPSPEDGNLRLEAQERAGNASKDTR